MKKIKACLAVAGLAWACSASALTIVVDGTLNRIGGNAVGNSIYDAFTTTEVDYIPFLVDPGMSVEIDVKSYERSQSAPFDQQDINGDGAIAYIDPAIYLFRFDGSLDVGDFTGQASEFSFDTFADGSINFLDPYLRIGAGILSPGFYLLAIGSDDLSLDQAIAGSNPMSLGPIGPDDTVAAFGAYQVTITVVPEPASAALLGAGVAGLLAWRRRAGRRTAA